MKNVYMRTSPYGHKRPTKAPSSILKRGTVISSLKGPTQDAKFRTSCIKYSINYEGIVTRTGRFKAKLKMYKCLTTVRPGRRGGASSSKWEEARPLCFDR